MHIYSETPLFSCLTILCSFRVPSSTHLGCWPWLYCFLAWPHTHPANSSYREVCMRGKIRKGPLLGSERRERGKKISLVFAVLLRLQKQDKALPYQRQKRRTPAELQGHLRSAAVAHLPSSTRCPLQIPSCSEWHFWRVATPPLPLGQWWPREERTRSITASYQQGAGSCCTFCRLKAMLWGDNLFSLTKP